MLRNFVSVSEKYSLPFALQDSFLPTMQEDTFQETSSAIKEGGMWYGEYYITRGTDICGISWPMLHNRRNGSQSLYVFFFPECPKGHRYFIGEVSIAFWSTDRWTNWLTEGPIDWSIYSLFDRLFVQLTDRFAAKKVNFFFKNTL